MSAQVITIEDLQAFKEDLIKELQQLFGSQPRKRQWLKSEDVREMLNISPGTLQTLRINRTLPFTKMGGTIFYDYDDVTRVLNENKRSV